MFKINPNPTFTATVTIPVPGGKPEKLKLTFRHKSRDQAKDYFDRIAKEAAEAIESGKTDDVARERRALEEIVAGWEDVDQPFSGDALEQLLQNYHGAATAILDTFTTELNLARRGN
ncbi:phage tail assembly chaperone [Cupriavidus gilardii]|uniref:Phage tail assembly chaperone n=1 Tax=Cupriavidus gilardii TaxID=82541 RepID=A0ABY4VSZ0_9BURK|nr:phage tail assembly chaperone [Cupriavidus gilardii]USE78906.1 phage tail assembly chaperone [Cupriavidus gilardii]UXC37193.1 phage tail assembly chaperone [Cupriavidus gilardii]